MLHELYMQCQTELTVESRKKASHAVFFSPSHPAGGSIDSDCAFEGDYAVPPLSMTEGMQHIRIMEGVSRSLPSSPLLSHQTISVRLQPVKKLTGKRRCTDVRFREKRKRKKKESARFESRFELVRQCCHTFKQKKKKKHTANRDVG